MSVYDDMAGGIARAIQIHEANKRKVRTFVVKVVPPLSPDRDKLPALVHGRHGAHLESQHLSPAVKAELGGDLFAYFEAERIDGRWWIGTRLPDADRGW